MTVYGYFRQDSSTTVSRLKELLQYGIAEIFIEKTELTAKDELASLLSKVSPKDTIVIPSFSSLGMKFEQLAPIIIEMDEKQVKLISIQEDIDISKKPQFISYIKILNDVNEVYRSEYEKEKKKRLEATNYVIGRPKISPEVIQEVENLHRQKYTLRMISEACGISLGAAHKYVTQLKEKEVTPDLN